MNGKSMNVSRRALLRATGAATLVLPLLRSERALAASPKRLILFATPNGLEHLRVLPPALEPWRSDLILVDGLDWKALAGTGDAHGGGVHGAFTAHVQNGSKAIGPSLDQYVAGALKPATKFSTIQMGVFSFNYGADRMIFGPGGAPIPFESSPKAAFDRLFGAVAVPGTTPATGPSAAEQLRLRRKSVFDQVMRELNATRGQLTAGERAKLDGHVEAIRSLERRLTEAPMPTTGGDSITGCTTTELGKRVGSANIPPYSADPSVHFPVAAGLQMDSTVLALACGLTTIATLRYDGKTGNLRHTWAGVSRGHHDLAHGGTAAAAEMKTVTGYYASQFATLLAKLKAVPDGTGTLLDSSVVLWGSDMADGAHGFKNSVYLVAGGGGGSLRPGRTLVVKGESQNDLFVSIARAMGVDTNSFGDPATCTGPLRGFA